MKSMTTQRGCLVYRRRGGFGDANSAGAVALADPSLISNVVPTQSILSTPQGSVTVQWCNANPLQALGTSDCWTNYFGGMSTPSIPQAYLQGAATAAPPSQAQINAQTPDQTTTQILQAAQQAAVDAATAAAGEDDTANNPPPQPPGGIAGWVWLVLAGVAVWAVAR